MQLLTITLAVLSGALAVGSSLLFPQGNDDDSGDTVLENIVITAYFTAVTATLLYHLGTP